MNKFIISDELIENGELLFYLNQYEELKYQRKISYLGKKVLFSTNDRTAFLWIHLFLEPYFQSVGMDSEIDLSFYAVYLPSSVDIAVQVNAVPEETTLHLRKRGTVWNISNSRLIARDERNQSYYIIDKDSRNIIYIAHQELDDAWKDPARMLREIIEKMMLGEGFLPFHASAVASDGGSFLFIGEKKSGKTTLALRFLQDYRCSFVSNDRVLIKGDDQGLIVHGSPLSVYVGIGTLLSMDKLKSQVHQVYNLGDISKTEEELWSVEKKVHFTPKEIGNMIGNEICASSRLDAIIAPKIGNEAEASIKSIDIHSAASLLRQSLLWPSDGWPNWFGIGHCDDEEWNDQQLRTWDMIRKIPLYEATCGKSVNFLASFLLKKES
ncbi:hypothetical protein ACQKLN_30450 [Paenibacillus glucanolyticus]|uniref:hypothetical protein n=1 Tax=Paenibacillus glucanolyticus TaxID=59843 RepID=UPI0036BDD3F2